MTPIDDAELALHFARLLREACLTPETWAAVVLSNDWKFSVLCTKNGKHAIRFRAAQTPDLTPVEFGAEARRCTRALGLTNWAVDQDVRRMFYELSFLSPAPRPAPTSEAV